MRKNKPDKKTHIPNPVPPAGMRADKRGKVIGVAHPDEESLLDEIAWRVEHEQGK